MPGLRTIKSGAGLINTNQTKTMTIAIITGLLIVWLLAMLVFIAVWHSFFTNEEQ